MKLTMIDKHIGKRGTERREAFETILKVFDALGAKVNFNVELNKRKIAH